MSKSSPSSALEAPSREQIENLAAQFREFALFGKEEGIPIQAHESSELPVFSQLNGADRQQVVDLFNKYFLAMSEVKREEKTLLRNLTSVWRMLSKAGLVPGSDLLSRAHEEDVIEIYDIGGRQIFRTLNFFPICTYSLEMLYSVPWFTLYERPDSNAQEAQLKLLNDFVAGTLKSAVDLPAEVHLVRESRKNPRTGKVRCTRIEPRYLAPLINRSGELGGYLSAFRVLENWDELIAP